MADAHSQTILSIDITQSSLPRSYDLIIGENILADAGSFLISRLGIRRCVVVTEANVAPFYLPTVENALQAAGHSLLPSLTIPAGERSKDYSTLKIVVDHFLKNGADRKTVVIALGGGVVGDLAGCAASLFMRGIDLIQIPTTLLAQVDSSVGGKTGIDTEHGKNTIGTFHQPRLVLIDVATLDSLPLRERRAGYAEIVKYGLIRDPAFFGWCVANGANVIGGNRAVQIKAIDVSCRHKSEIVMSDEREAGVRALLNLGHTFGHALETADGYRDLLHGEAVAIGCVMAFQLSAKLGLCPQPDADAVRDHMKMVGLPAAPPKGSYEIGALLALMKHDKKAENGKLTLILTHGIGKAFICRDVSDDQVRDIWQEFLI